MATRTPGRAIVDGTHLIGQDNQVVAVCRQAKPRNTMVALANAKHLARCWNVIEEYCSGDPEKVLELACREVARDKGFFPKEDAPVSRR